MALMIGLRVIQRQCFGSRPRIESNVIGSTLSEPKPYPAFWIGAIDLCKCR